MAKEESGVPMAIDVKEEVAMEVSEEVKGKSFVSPGNDLYHLQLFSLIDRNIKLTVIRDLESMTFYLQKHLS